MSTLSVSAASAITFQHLKMQDRENENIYYNLLNTYGSGNIWNNFRNLPYYIVKGYPNNSNFQYNEKKG